MVFSLIAAGATAAVSTAQALLTAAGIVSATGTLLIATQPLIDHICDKRDED